jgi:hypothetical protein
MIFWNDSQTAWPFFEEPLKTPFVLFLESLASVKHGTNQAGTDCWNLIFSVINGCMHSGILSVSIPDLFSFGHGIRYTTSINK